MPLLLSCRALHARDELVAYFQAGITAARQQLAEGQEVGGVLGRMVSAQDEEGNRWACVCGWLAATCRHRRKTAEEEKAEREGRWWQYGLWNRKPAEVSLAKPSYVGAACAGVSCSHHSAD